MPIVRILQNQGGQRNGSLGDSRFLVEHIGHDPVQFQIIARANLNT